MAEFCGFILKEEEDLKAMEQYIKQEEQAGFFLIRTNIVA